MKGKLGPAVAVAACIFGAIGHLLKMAKMWLVLLDIGFAIGIIMGIGAVVANYTSAGSGCFS